MPKVSKNSAEQVEKLEGYFEGRYADLGGYMAGFETYPVESRPQAAARRPAGRHVPVTALGYVLKGKVAFRFADHEETYEAGDAYYAPPGHSLVFYEGGEVVEFSPVDKLSATIEMAMKNMQAGLMPGPVSG